ncbi:MAG: hypothetical protein HRU13_13205, partial [Phycisphaerales bacterium]|nr:hypothetical protein [Phycisphaerales bacterium]
MPKPNFTNEQIERLINSVYKGAVGVNTLPEWLYLLIAERIYEGMVAGFGGDLFDFEFEGIEYETLLSFRNNAYVFSA